jgi:hypothetical protein
VVRLGRRPDLLADPAHWLTAGSSQPPRGETGAAAMTFGAWILAAPLFALASEAPPSLDEVVARYVAARGGREAMAAVRTLRMTGHAFAGPGREAIVRREIARPGCIRTEFVFQGTTGVYAWNGSAGWRVSPLDGSLEAEDLPAEEAASAAEQADIEGPLVDWKAKGHTLELVGTVSLPQGPAHELKLTLGSGSVRHVFLDATTGRVVKTESVRRLSGREVHLETTFGDYRAVSGVAFPHAIETGVRNRPRRLRIAVDEVEMNPPLDAARFEKPR